LNWLVTLPLVSEGLKEQLACQGAILPPSLCPSRLVVPPTGAWSRNRSYIRSSAGWRPAQSNEDLFPRRTSQYRVNREIPKTAPPASSRERFIFPSASSKTGAPPPSQPGSPPPPAPSSFATPSRTTIPRSLLSTTSLATVTCDPAPLLDRSWHRHQRPQTDPTQTIHPSDTDHTPSDTDHS
jgi:hypothetical protein